MAIYHLNMRHVSRSTGRSCVQAVAYICRENILEERRGITADYRSRYENVFWETLAPVGSGIDRKNLSIWNDLDMFEDTFADHKFKDAVAREKFKRSARTAHTYVYALPKELTQDQNKELVRSIVEERFVARGLIATTAYHFEEGNPHVHICVSNRAVEGNIKEGGTFSRIKVAREIFPRRELVLTRQIFADKANQMFESLGMDIRIDHRSFEDRDINLIPSIHKDFKVHQLERNGVESRISEENARILEENKERISREPSIIIRELSATRATFSEMDILRLIQKRMLDDPSILSTYVFESVMTQIVEVGTGMDNQKRYTTQEYADQESRILESFDKYQENKASILIDPQRVEEMIHKLKEEGKESNFSPNEGQVNGIRTLCGDSQFSILIGRAGTGKTTTMKPVVQLHQEAGYRVMGMAPSAVAASQLEADTGCSSDTIAHYAYYWKKYEEAVELLQKAETRQEAKAAQKLVDKYAPSLPDSKTLVLVDEAGMVGVGNAKGAIPGGWDAITKAIDQSGAKLIVTGDDHQHKPVERGDVYRRLVYNLSGQANLCKLTDIVRQKIPWMREASHHLAEHNVSTALGMYENHGHIEGYASNTQVYEATARQYLRNIIREPDSRGIVVAATNEERLALNREIRSVLKENGLLPQEDILQRGEDGYCVGDKIIFTENDRGWKTRFESPDRNFFVQNSMKATIQSITPFRLIDQETGEISDTYEIVASVPDRKATVKFNLEDFKGFNHAYAVTSYKSQGGTLDWVLVKVSPLMDAHSLYVCLTRHLWEVTVYYSHDDFANHQALINSLSKVSIKDLVADYSISDDHHDYWQNVQDYKYVGRELQQIRRFANSLNKENKEGLESVWKEYRFTEEDRKSCAKLILSDWEDHKDFVRQAGLTKESVEIAAGDKKRSLSRLEQEAQVVVEQYVSVALETRQSWRMIRRTHPGSRAKAHPEWQKFEDARHQRGILANQICLQPVLYKPFLKEAAHNLAKADIGYVTKDHKVSYSMATIKAQAEAHQSKILQDRLLKDDAHSQQRPLLKTLVAYTENRDMAGSVWQEIKPKLKNLEGTLLKDSLTKYTAEYRDLRMKRDASALLIMEKPDSFIELAESVGIKLDWDKVKDHALQGKRDKLIAVYKDALEEMTRLEAAHTLNDMVKEEASFEKKLTLYSLYDQGLTYKGISDGAREYQKLKVFGSLKTEPERSLFLLLDEYGDKCQKANELYAKCANDVKDKEGLKPWNSGHYKDYKAACEKRNDNALEIFGQRDHNQVIQMAEDMGIRFKDVELGEIFSRCEQADRNRHIAAYLEAKTPDSKGEAAIALRQMIQFEKRKWDDVSSTARQAFYAGIDFKELQVTAFDYGRACVLKNLSSEQEVQIYHGLEAYENAFRPANRAYKECLDESKEKTKPDNEVKPWETDKFKEYIPLVAIQDEKAHHLLKSFEFGSVAKVAQQMGISVKKLDVEAHRHSLRQTLQTYLDGDRTNVPMAAQEVMNWLEFDRHSNHKHTFKILREQDLWPKEIFESVQEFIDKKRVWRHEEKSGAKDDARKAARTLSPSSSDYKTIMHERRLSYKEIKHLLEENIVDLSISIMGNPTGRKPKDLRFGSKGSVNVCIDGSKQGRYSNFETQLYGGPFDLIQDQLGLASWREALEWARDWLGGKAVSLEQKSVHRRKEVVSQAEQSNWTPITPVPENADKITNRHLYCWLKDGGKEEGRYAYRDEEGRLLGYVFRMKFPDGSKITPPLSWCRNEKGEERWKWQGFFEGERSAYGLEKLAHDPIRPVLVVEGERKADIAQKLLPGYHVLGWLGGAGAVGKTNWECLAGKEVVIWPDNDKRGFQAADTFQKIVRSLNTEKGLQGTVGIVSLPEGLPEKWDLADKLPEGWTPQTVERMIKEAVPQKEKTNFVSEIDAPQGGTTKDAHKREYTPEEKQILDYLRKELTPEKSPWLDESDFKSFREAAERNPSHMLKRWQEITDDYSFGVSHKDEPRKLTEQQQIAQNLLASVEGFATHKMMKEWNDLLSHSPQTVIDECQNLMQQHKADMESLTQDARRELAARKFLALCDEQKNMMYSDPKFKDLEKDIEAIAKAYLKDERFMERIKGSTNENAIHKVTETLREQERPRSRSHGMEM